MTAGPGHAPDLFADAPGTARRWLFTDIEFKVLCDDFRRGKLPKPFTFTSRIRSAEAYAAARDHARRTLEARTDSAFDELIGAISRPDVIVVARGWDERDPQAPESCTYVHAVCRGSRGYVLRQRIGETTQHSEGFDIAECPPAGVAAAVAGLLPPAAAGRRPEFTLESGPEPDTGHIRAFFDTPATGTGYLRVLQSRLHFRLPGITQTSAVWRDLPGDGRYLICSEGARSTVTGMDHRRLAGWIDGWIGAIVHRLDSGE